MSLAKKSNPTFSANQKREWILHGICTLLTFVFIIGSLDSLCHCWWTKIEKAYICTYFQRNRGNERLMEKCNGIQLKKGFFFCRAMGRGNDTIWNHGLVLGLSEIWSHRIQTQSWTLFKDEFHCINMPIFTQESLTLKFFAKVYFMCGYYPIVLNIIDGT